MAKPILYYALVRGGWSHAPGGFRVLGVTSEKGRQVYGRDATDAVTHVSDRDVLHRFPEGTTEAHARAALERASRVQERLMPGVRRAEEDYRRKGRELQAAVLLAMAEPEVR